MEDTVDGQKNSEDLEGSILEQQMNLKSSSVPMIEFKCDINLKEEESNRQDIVTSVPSETFLNPQFNQIATESDMNYQQIILNPNSPPLSSKQEVVADLEESSIGELPTSLSNIQL